MALLSKWLHEKRTSLVVPYIMGDVLDVGCGPASNYKFAKDKIINYYGLEYDKEYLEQLRKEYPNTKFFQRDLEEDDFNLDIKFDCILLIAVIEHILNQKHLFKEILKYLKPDGKIVITTPTLFGDDIVYRIGERIGLWGGIGTGHDNHVIIYNKRRFKILAYEFNLKIEKYKTFELGCNQLVIMCRN